MSFFYSFIWSSVGKKIITAITGLGLYLYIMLHLAGNLTLFAKDPGLFNRYAHFLTGFGWLLIIIELGLLLLFLIHIIGGIIVYLGKLRARPDGYVRYESAGVPSKKTVSSTTMIWTGLVIGLFATLHVITFKYGPGMEQGYVTVVNGVQMRDLYRLVIEVFSNKWNVIWYVGAMIFLGFHLRHAFWSAFQSLGANNPRLTPVFYGAGLALAVLLALGFLILPIFIYFTGAAT
jgi:succinate dehydrogenase / fumarate reductase cytochrome b subunit